MQRAARAADDRFTQRIPVRTTGGRRHGLDLGLRIDGIARHPHIDPQRLEVGAALLFRLNHETILHSGVWHFANEVGTGPKDLAGFHQDLAFDRQVNLGTACQAQIRAALPLPYAFAESNK